MSAELPLLPYAGTSGHAGTETSRERAERDDADGTTAGRQALVLGNMSAMGRAGITVKDLRDITGLHHGQVSSVLTVLHKEGAIFRLTETRDRCKVYVMPEFVGGRETEPYRRNHSDANRALDRVNAYLTHAEQMGLDRVYIASLRRVIATKEN